MMAKRKIPFDPRIIEAEGNLLIDYQFLLQERMSQKGISQSDLAERAGISKARLSQIISDDANPTLKTFAGLFHALGERVHVSSVPAGELEKPQSQEPMAALEWEWVKTVRMDQPIDEDMVALMKNAVPSIERGSMASNDNCTNRRIHFVDSELATALLEDEAA